MQDELGQVFLMVLSLQEGLLEILSLFCWLVDYVLIFGNVNHEDQLFLSRNYVFLGSPSFPLKMPTLPLIACLLYFRSPHLQT